MRKFKGFLFILSLLFAVSVASAQEQITVKGKVTDGADRSVLPGVNVIVKGTGTGTSTGIDGTYTLTVDKGAILVFSFVGMESQEIPANSAEINVEMKSNQQLDEVVVIGYGTVRKTNLSGAVSSMTPKDLQANITTNAANALQGRIAGVSVTSSSGQPGQGMDITVRGLSSLRNNAPLYVIDGVYGDINLIDPSDIASLEVLKDASAAAIYGSRAANGVVLITTKSGRKDMPMKVTVNAYAGVQTLAKKLDVLNGHDWVEIMKAHKEGFPITSYEGKGTDWQDAIFRTAALTKVNVGITGGTKKAVYNVSAGYIYQDGIMVNSGYKAFNLRVKNQFNFFNDKVRLGETLIVKSSHKNRAANEGGDISSILLMPPTVKVYDDTRMGGYGAVESWMRNLANPVGYAKVNDYRDNLTEILINAYAEIDLFKGLKYKFNMGYTKNNGNGYERVGIYDFGPAGKNELPDLKESSSVSDTWLAENTLHYDRVLGKHTVSALFGYSAQKTQTRNIYASRNNLPIGTDGLNAGPSDTQAAGGTLNENSLVSLFGRLMYSFDDRYMFSASIRRDGSSRFADGHRYGVFPSVSVGWNIHNEKFFEAASSVMNQFKLRFSYGVLGNQEIGNYLTEKVTNYGINYVQGGTWWQGSIPGANWTSPKDLTWEETATYNYGIDLGFFHNKLTLTADYFIQNTSDVLLAIDMAPSAGLKGAATMNAGDVQNKGIEIAIDHRNQIGDFTYNIGVNFSAIKNKLKKVTVGDNTEFAGYNPQGEGTITWAKVGKPIGAFYLLKTDGLFQSAEEVQAYKNKDGKLIQRKAEPGDIRFVDGNGDGTINKDNDTKYAGSAFPDFTYGIRAGLGWKGIDMNLFFDGVHGNKIYNYPRARREQMKEVHNFATSVKNAWTPQNRNTSMPRFTMEDPNENAQRVSDRWLEDGSFFRLKTMEFGYTFPKTWMSKISLSNLRVYAAFENVFMITDYKGYTPDLGQKNNGQGDDGVLYRGTDHGRYPVPRTYTFGLQVEF